MRILFLAIALIAAFVPFVPVIFIAATITFTVALAARPLRREKTRCEAQPVALLSLVSFRAPPAFV